ncbi:hypothetical protein TOPH_00804 [Tolypocladium ophioglossoides CBS 100239]|uniref:Nephrocystin 3-like N-terminal domain-containing protein n=1 Tax=Tolypocladium ophioglossoides (strain CBS 100239) TaxID=1163406 RepID=A0A0L0NJG7_TOLOC|nr:hypothetical protein TOPH_00804 [Tolypocladium ophioglossoides CBS 100239]
MGNPRRLLSKLFRKRQAETPSHFETQRLVPSSGSSPPVPISDGAAVSHDCTDVTVVHGLTGNRDSNRTTPKQSNSLLLGLVSPPPADPKTENPPRLVVGSLWEKAADSLDPEDRKKRDHLIKCKREDHAADPIPEGQGGSSATEDLWGSLATGDVNHILSRAKRLNEEDKEATCRPVVNKIIKGVMNFKSLGDAAVKFDKSGYAALGWSVVSFGLQVAENAKEAREFVFHSSEVVTGYMTRYAEYEKLFRGPLAGEEFDRCLTEVYKAILLYVMALDSYLRKCKAEHMAGAVFELRDRSIVDKKDAIDAVDKEVKDWLLIIKTNTDNEKFSRDRSHGIDSAVEGTCKWLLWHESYTSWAACKPGCGKSTLLRYALDNVRTVTDIRSNTLILSFFFHGRGAELQKTPLGFFRSILHQILIQAPETLSNLVDTFQQRCNTFGEPGEKWQWHPRELLRLFKLALPKILENHSILLFIDALDECGEENAVDLAGKFKSLLQGLPPTGSQFRICFSCRHYPILDLDYGFEICPERENAQDISTYVQAQLSSLTASTNPATIQTTIKNGASGVFMWARLVIERILYLQRRGFGWKMIEEKIHTIPPDLDKL